MMEGRPPRSPEIGVIGLVYHPWSRMHATVHPLLLRLADYYHVVYVDPPHQWRDALRPRTPLDTSEEQRTHPGFQVYRPDRWLPRFYRPAWLAHLTFRARLRRARSLLAARGCRRFVLYIFHPQFAGALDLLPHDLSCYHLEDEYSFSSEEQPISAEEAALLARVDQVFIHSRALVAKKGQLNPHTAQIPNGVDFAAYATPVDEPADLAHIPHPRIGYTGRIKRQLDWTLIAALAARRPEWSFVFVGAVNQHPELAPVLDALRRRPNVHFLGGKTTRELAAYPQHFDVCIMPYVLDAYTRYIYPLKLHEYLASGRPVVGTPIPALEEFHDVVAVARTPDEWDAALAGYLAQRDDPAAREARRAVARRFDWDALTAEIADTFAARLGIAPPAHPVRDVAEHETHACRATP
ncbi:MAG TPA: glycosyltransferase [Gemmatimonadaceae bacterium]|nr:glycosyltransferase [Gemmatimonadaceae bacterium]